MSPEEIKHLLKAHGVSPNKLLGQNFMVEPSLFPKLCFYASINQSDVVLDVGAGLGFLTCYLADKCKKVIAVEKDKQLSAVLRERVTLSKILVLEGDVLKIDLPDFNKVVAIPPYYLSSKLFLKIIERRFECAVLIVQQEFASRLVAAVKSEDYSWLTVEAKRTVAIEVLDKVPKSMFYPQPQVDSVIIRFKPLSKPLFTVKNEALFRQMLKMLFTERNKKLQNALLPFIKNTLKMDGEKAKAIVSTLPLRATRIRELTPEDFGEISNALFDEKNAV
jgi:16S rRNA (adenine1518-N6/adenine1519-N6)-dimethyltransferase